MDMLTPDIVRCLGWQPPSEVRCARRARREECLRIEGSAVMIAPGLAVTASHVFMDDWDALQAGKERMALQGIRSDGTADMWNVRDITRTAGDDMALLARACLSRS
jgi:hypothetical protein